MAEPGLGEGGLEENKNLKEVKAPAEPPAGCCSCDKRARFFLHSPVGFSCQCDAEWECSDFSLCSERCKGLYWEVSFIGGSKAAVGGRDECGSCGSRIIFDTVFKVTALDANGLATSRKVRRSAGHLEGGGGGGGGGGGKMQKKQKKKKKKTEQQKAVAASIAEAVAKVKETGAREPLPPMPAWQRLKAHQAAEATGLQSRSEGEGAARFVVLLPAP